VSARTGPAHADCHTYCYSHSDGDSYADSNRYRYRDADCHTYDYSWFGRQCLYQTPGWDG
jgi:hypothetical protein